MGPLRPRPPTMILRGPIHLDRRTRFPQEWPPWSLPEWGNPTGISQTSVLPRKSRCRKESYLPHSKNLHVGLYAYVPQCECLRNMTCPVLGLVIVLGLELAPVTTHHPLPWPLPDMRSREFLSPCYAHHRHVPGESNRSPYS